MTMNNHQKTNKKEFIIGLGLGSIWIPIGILIYILCYNLQRYFYSDLIGFLLDRFRLIYAFMLGYLSLIIYLGLKRKFETIKGVLIGILVSGFITIASCYGIIWIIYNW